MFRLGGSFGAVGVDGGQSRIDTASTLAAGVEGLVRTAQAGRLGADSLGLMSTVAGTLLRGLWDED